MIVQTKQLRAIRSSQIDKEHPAEVSGTETGSGNMKTLTKEVVLAARSLQKDSATKTSTDEISSRPESDRITIANIDDSGSKKPADADGISASES